MLPRASTDAGLALSLGSVVRSNAHCTRRPVRVSCASRGISVVAELLPTHLQGASAVYLSSNAISSLRGVGQFYAVRTLSLSNNRVADFEQLRFLRPCAQLRSLSLSGNPVCSQPFYRSRVLHLARAHLGLSRLERLDGTRVGGVGEYAEARAALGRHTRALSLLLSTECRIAQLALIARLVPMHRQLIAVSCGLSDGGPAVSPRVGGGIKRVFVVLRACGGLRHSRHMRSGGSGEREPALAMPLRLDILFRCEQRGPERRASLPVVI